MNSALSAIAADARRFRSGLTLSALVPPVVLLLAFIAFHQAYTTLRLDGTVHSDGEGYYAYLPAYLIYFDPSFKALISNHLIPAYAGLGHVPPAAFGFSLQPNGYWLDKYGIGTAVLMLPFFLVGHAVAIATTANANGYSSPELIAVGAAAATYMTAGLYVLRALLLRWFAEWAVIVTLVAVTFGAGLFATAIWDPSFSHTYSFFAVALALLLAVRWYERPKSGPRIMALGAACGLIVDIRLTNGVLLIALPLLGVGSRRQASQRSQLLWTHRWHVVAGAAATALVLFPQSLVWHVATGHWLVRTYPGEPFDFLHPHLLDTLVSFKPHGLFPYYPALLFSVAGLVIAWVRRRDLALPVTAALLVFWYLVSSWWDWSFSFGFGNRAFVDVLPLLAIPMALFFSSLWVRLLRVRLLRVAATGAAVLFAGVTCVLMVAYWQGILPGDGAKISQYFSILGHPPI